MLRTHPKTNPPKPPGGGGAAATEALRQTSLNDLKQSNFITINILKGFA